jgi:iron complex outermembrane receptor protein
MRQDFSLGYTRPFCPSFSTDIPIIKGIKVNFGVSSNYRVPTLNDKYGNPDLKPENSLNIEMGAVFHLPKSKYYESQISMSIYNLLIDNLIQWVPINSAIWKPQNIQKVWSRGLEISSKTDWEIFGMQGYFKFAYTYSPSTYRKTSSAEQGLLNKQLIYIPIHKVIEVFYLTKGTYYTMFSYSVNGKRYVQADNSKVLPAYTMIEITAGKTFTAKKIKFKLQAEVSNLFNTVYQSVLYYPEPGRAYSINLLISK